MKLSQIRWGRAVAGTLAAEVILVAAAFAWVAIYSYLIHPGETGAFYESYAQSASPYVSLILGFPVFFLVSRRMGSRATALAMFAVYCLIEVPLTIAFPNPAIGAWFHFVNFPAKFLGCYWGGRP